MSDLEKIESFIGKHHVLSLATSDGDELSVCNLFYLYSERCFVVASSDETTHIKHIKIDSKVAGGIVLETKEIGKIQGLQFRGVFKELDNAKLKKAYFKRFPYALAMLPKLWKIEMSYFKLTDNRLGFGKKVIWQEP